MEEPMPGLTHDLMAGILSRVPYKSLCICKCVCPAWRHLIADPVYRKKIVQSLAGFFYHTTAKREADSAEPRGLAVNYADLSASPWASVPRTYPRLPLPPDSTECFFTLEDSCDGLFLTRIRTGTPELQFRYMVSNPATRQLFYINSDDREEGYGSPPFSTVSVYVRSSGIYNWDVSHLDDGCTHWILLHKLSNVIPRKNFCLSRHLKVVGVHPHANIIFLADWNNNELLAYDLDHHESTAVLRIERTYCAHEQYFPYVPLLSSLRLATPS
ncbi:hypothetical protein TRIUR3_04981 [Triticum urartu]|uniref:Uncharacterized protein n=1 Tax=Triticum urartu TaxID=4572 RepID=M7ZD34_TRIUA|nr:hypothetical protein TRIUR3_04981 [Triticum urartu]